MTINLTPTQLAAIADLVAKKMYENAIKAKLTLKYFRNALIG
jgi:hypothetical protein